MTHSWERLAARADRLAADGAEASALLAFYANTLRAQGQVQARLAGGGLDRQAPVSRQFARLAAAADPLIIAVRQHGSDALKAEAASLAGDSTRVATMLEEFWATPSDRAFFAKALLQPWARAVVDGGGRLPDREASMADTERCPACGGRAQLAILQAVPEGEGGSRSLLCSLCLSVWPSRRVLCPRCGEEDEPKLGYFQADAFEHVRVEVCDSCRHYVKAVDLTRLGIAQPLVDEVAAGALDVWAQDRGYTKLELNLVGL